MSYRIPGQYFWGSFLLIRLFWKVNVKEMIRRVFLANRARDE
jgi:hypothetical protein